MKIKTVVTNKKRHELKKMVLELTKSTEIKTKELNEIKIKLMKNDEALRDIADRLIAQRRSTEEAVNDNEVMTKDYYNQSKEINRLTDIVMAANAEIERRDKMINNLNDTISILQGKVTNLLDYTDNLKQPFWKKLFK